MHAAEHAYRQKMFEMALGILNIQLAVTTCRRRWAGWWRSGWRQRRGWERVVREESRAQVSLIVVLSWSLGCCGVPVLGWCGEDQCKYERSTVVKVGSWLDLRWKMHQKGIKMSVSCECIRIQVEVEKHLGRHNVQIWKEGWRFAETSHEWIVTICHLLCTINCDRCNGLF